MNRASPAAVKDYIVTANPDELQELKAVISHREYELEQRRKKLQKSVSHRVQESTNSNIR
jgi:hypothetical protein